MTTTIIIFLALSIVNVIGSTFRSLVTIKGNKYVASLANALYFAFYNIVLIYTTMEFSLITKCIITFATNLIGVFIVKVIEEKGKREKLWLVKMTCTEKMSEKVKSILVENEISYSCYSIQNGNICFDCFCNTQKDTKVVTDLAKVVKGKTFATENKLY